MAEQKRILKEHIKNVAEEDYNEDIKLAPAWGEKGANSTMKFIELSQ